VIKGDQTNQKPVASSPPLLPSLLPSYNIPSMANRVTRVSNANTHPGVVDRPPPRRSKQEVEEAKQAKVAAKAEVERQKAANIQKVAKLESEAKRKKADMD
jgi:hypothetical protein